MINALIFDLDGTLVDSSSGILNSLSWAFTSLDLTPAIELTPAIIGPPLPHILKILSPHSSESELQELFITFKCYYDDVGFEETFAFSGAKEMLQDLASHSNIELYIATNKRKKPALQIINKLAWSHYFSSILSLDSFSPPLPSKASILSQILFRSKCKASNSLYVGDRVDDYKAALTLNMPFAFAAWGFEGNDLNFGQDVFKLDTLDASLLLNCLAR